MMLPLPSSRVLSAGVLGLSCFILLVFSLAYLHRDRITFPAAVDKNGPFSGHNLPSAPHPPSDRPSYLQYAKDFKKPEGMRVIALVFFGRKEFIEILDCYLKRNLIENGGIVDEVIFAVNTKEEHDLQYLEHLLTTSPRYTKYVQKNNFKGWSSTWESVERGNVYIKIDDDVVFAEDSAIPAIVKRLIENPQYFAVSANSLNNPQLTYTHFSLGVYQPYWPELQKPNLPDNASLEWRASRLPTWEGPEDYSINGSQSAPDKNHRWLPLRNNKFDILDSPIGRISPGSRINYDPGLLDWTVAAQTHYSFLEHLENDELWRYKFNLWDYKYTRISINFIAFRGDDILDAYPFPVDDDEYYLTMVRPKELKRHVMLDGTVMTAHYAFGPQRWSADNKALTHTDVLARYRAFANEMICPYPSQAGTPRPGA